jgi:hypothetical protein
MENQLAILYPAAAYTHEDPIGTFPWGQYTPNPKKAQWPKGNSQRFRKPSTQGWYPPD